MARRRLPVSREGRAFLRR